MTDKKALSTILERAAELIEPAGKWASMGGMAQSAKNSHGNGVDPRSAEAECWCVYGAIVRAASDLHLGGMYSACDALDLHLGTDARGTIRWNDSQGRTQTEAVQALREAARKVLAQ